MTHIYLIVIAGREYAMQYKPGWDKRIKLHNKSVVQAVLSIKLEKWSSFKKECMLIVYGVVVYNIRSAKNKKIL